MNLTNQEKETLKKIVTSLMNDGSALFRGTFDAVNGSTTFMHGVLTVLEALAFNVDEEFYTEVSETFFKNFCESLDKANKL